VQSPFRRKSTDLIDDAAASVAGAHADSGASKVAGARARAYTPSKRDLGAATPKRKQSGRVAEPPPANRREALKRMRQQQREARAEQRAGMLAGDERHLPPRDKGPERALVRDIVDSRRNVATYFLPGALIVILGSSTAMPPAVQLGANLFWIMLAIGVVVDSFLLTRRIKRSITQKFPKSPQAPRSYYFYAIMRSLSIRRLRMPKPRVKVGAKV
jgi:hypothetical protein